MNRRQETMAVKAALLKAGLPVRRVKHGTGTAWGWLDIYFEHQDYDPVTYRAHYRQAVSIAQQVTGRHGEYNGKINVH